MRVHTEGYIRFDPRWGACHPWSLQAARSPAALAVVCGAHSARGGAVVSAALGCENTRMLQVIEPLIGEGKKPSAPPFAYGTT